MLAVSACVNYDSFLDYIHIERDQWCNLRYCELWTVRLWIWSGFDHFQREYFIWFVSFNERQRPMWFIFKHVMIFFSHRHFIMRFRCTIQCISTAGVALRFHFHCVLTLQYYLNHTYGILCLFIYLILLACFGSICSLRWNRHHKSKQHSSDWSSLSYDEAYDGGEISTTILVLSITILKPPSGKNLSLERTVVHPTLWFLTFLCQSALKIF